MGSLTGESHSTYTVILRACGNEATTWRDGRWAWVAAIDVAFIPSRAPGGDACRTLLVDYCLTAVCWSTCKRVPVYSWVRDILSMYTSSIMSEFIPKHWKGFFLLSEIKQLTLDIQASECILKKCVNYVCWIYLDDVYRCFEWRKRSRTDENPRKTEKRNGSMKWMAPCATSALFVLVFGSM